MMRVAEPLEAALRGSGPQPVRLPTELFVLPLSESDYLVYAPLRRAALIANAALVCFLGKLQAGERSVDAAEGNPLDVGTLPTGDELAAELERYLRDERSDGSPPDDV